MARASLNRVIGEKSPLRSLWERQPCPGVNECNRLLTTIDIGWFGSFPLFKVCGGSQRHFACRLRGAIVD